MLFLIIVVGLITITSVFMTKPLTEEDIECPVCGSHNTDGNHCYQCGEDF